MARITGHCLNSVFGSNAADLCVRLVECDALGTNVIFDTRTDSGGRLDEAVDLTTQGPDTVYELRYSTASYLAEDGTDPQRRSIIPEVVFAFRMPDSSAHYHFSMAFTPGSSQVLAVVL